MSSNRQILKIVAVATILVMSLSTLVLVGLYLKAIEYEKDRLAHLSFLHVQHLIGLSQRSIEWDEENVSQSFLLNRIQNLFFSQNDQHYFGQTGEVILVRLHNNELMEVSAPSPDYFRRAQSPLLLRKNPFQFQFDFYGSSQSQILPDGRGNMVVAAYEPFTSLSMGIVTKLNIEEILLPYLMAGGIIFLLETGIMGLAGLMLMRYTTSTAQHLSKEQENILAAVAGAGQGIVTFNEFGKIETFDKAAEEMFSCRASEMIGMPFEILVVISEQEACNLFFFFFLLSGEKYSGGFLKEFKGQKRDGNVFSLTVTLTEMPLPGHRSFTALLQNATKQKFAERRLAAQYAVARVLADCTTIEQATPEILRAVCESLNWQLGVLWQVEPKTRLLRCVKIWGASSSRFSKFVTVTQEMSFSKGVGLPGRIWTTGKPIWIPDVVQDSNFPRAPIASHAGLHAAFAFPIRLGEVIHGVMEFFSREIQEPDEALLHQMLSVGSQIGQFMQRKEAEMALRESEEQTRLILDTALDAVVTLDQNGHIIEWNSQAEKMFGWSRQEILGKSMALTIIPHKYRDAHQQGIQRYLTSEVSEILNKRIELSGLHRDGHEFPLEIAITAIRSQKGLIFSGFLRDLTERRQTEDALLKSEEQRRQAQKMEAMGTLAGGIAHDFNNILSAIIGYTELAMAQIGVDNKILPRLQEVLRASYRAKNLVRQILTFSRQNDSGKKVMYMQPIVEEALNLLRASLPSTITLHAELQGDSAPVLADATQIHQVVMNLGANAEYAMRATGGRLTVKLDEVKINNERAFLPQGLHEGLYIRLQVSDSGQGMPPSIRKRIFDPFFTTKNVGEGTGMGLSVIHGVVTSHGGAIQVDSQEGVGTVFTIHLPCSSLPVAEQQVSAMPSSLIGKGTIMFVDDEVSIASWAKDMLEELGYVVVVFTNGREALHAFKQAPDQFDVIVTDQTMPGMTGELLACQVMKIRPRFPIILCSGFSYTMNEEKALGMGLRAYLTKPVSMCDMAKALQVALDRSVSR